MPELRKGDVVRVRLNQNIRKEDLHRAEVQSKVATRSYEVVTEDGRGFRRNRTDLRKTPENFDLDGLQSLQEQEAEPEFETVTQPAQICETAVEAQTTSREHTQSSQQDDPVASATRSADVYMPSMVCPEQRTQLVDW